MDLKPPSFSWTLDVKKWLRRFQVIAAAQAWDKPKQSQMMPAFFDDAVLAEFLDTGIDGLAPLDDKFKKILAFLRKHFKSEDQYSASYAEFQAKKLLPGQEISEFKKALEDLLNRSIPDLSKEQCQFMVIQKILNELPTNISQQLRILDKLDLDSLCRKA